MREIDTVMVKGSLTPMRLFTCDLNTNLVTEHCRFREMKTAERKAER